MVELLFPATLRQDMRDGLVDLPSLGQTAGVCYESVMLRYICLPTYNSRGSGIRQVPKLEYLYSSWGGVLTTSLVYYSLQRQTSPCDSSTTGTRLNS